MKMNIYDKVADGSVINPVQFALSAAASLKPTDNRSFWSAKIESKKKEIADWGQLHKNEKIRRYLIVKGIREKASMTSIDRQQTEARRFQEMIDQVESTIPPSRLKRQIAGYLQTEMDIRCSGCAGEGIPAFESWERKMLSDLHADVDGLTCRLLKNEAELAEFDESMWAIQESFQKSGSGDLDSPSLGGEEG